MRSIGLWVMGIVVGWAASGTTMSRGVEMGDIVRNSGEAKGFKTLDNYYRTQVSQSDRSALFELQRSEDLGLALRAAWELVIREASEREPEDIDEGVRISELSSAHHFVGFAEGCLRKSIPAWWGGAILDGTFAQHTFQPGDAFGFAPGAGELFDEAKWRIGPLPANFYRYHPIKNIEDGLKMGPGTLTWTEDVLSITLGDRRINVPEQIVKATHPFNVIVFQIIGDSSVIATCNRQFAVSYPICRLKSDDGTVLWTTQVVGGEDGGGNIRGMSHFVDFAVDGKVLYAYGLDRSMVYVEAFDLETGRPVFRFGTNYGLKALPVEDE